MMTRHQLDRRIAGLSWQMDARRDLAQAHATRLCQRLLGPHCQQVARYGLAALALALSWRPWRGWRG